MCFNAYVQNAVRVHFLAGGSGVKLALEPCVEPFHRVRLHFVVYFFHLGRSDVVLSGFVVKQRPSSSKLFDVVRFEECEAEKLATVVLAM